MLKFITGNKGKFSEATIMLAPLKVRQVNINLDEIQSLDPEVVVKHKLQQALKKEKGDFFIEDDCLFFKGLNNKLPGPYAKHFWEALTSTGVYKLISRLSSDVAEMRATIGYVDAKGKINFFNSSVWGRIVEPKGNFGFGYDPIFEPKGTGKTLSQLKASGNFNYSPRSEAMEKLKNYLRSK